MFLRRSLRKRDVLRLLALGRSSPEIAEQLYILVEPANMYRRNVRQKLGASTSFELAEDARAFDLL